MLEKVDKNETWGWLIRSGVKVETETLLCAAQEQDIRTNYLKHHIDRRIENPFVECVVKEEKVCNT